MAKQNHVKIAVSPKFRTKLKILSAQTELSMVELTDEIGDMLDDFEFRRKRKYGLNI